MTSGVLCKQVQSSRQICLVLLASYVRQRTRNNMAACNASLLVEKKRKEKKICSLLVATIKVSLPDMNAVPCFEHVNIST